MDYFKLTAGVLRPIMPIDYGILNLGKVGPTFQMADKRLKLLFCALSNALHAGITNISHPADQTEVVRLLFGVGSEANRLHIPMNCCGNFLHKN
jgi:hypothetical protein